MKKQENDIEKTWVRNCPECGKEIPYTRKFDRDRAERRNRNCKLCALRSEKIRKKISKSCKEIKHKPCSEETKKKISESKRGCVPWNKGLTKYDDPRLKCSDKSKKKSRLSAIKRIKKQNGQISPNYNKSAISKIEAEAKKYNVTDLQHAETPDGEFQVCGYFVDGRSKEKNIVFEYYEKAHKYQTERDERRKQEIIKELDCKFIEIKEWENYEEIAG